MNRLTLTIGLGVAMIVALGLSSCKKKTLCDDAKARTIQKQRECFEAEEAYYLNPSNPNKGDFDLAKQQWIEAEKNENNTCN